MDIVFLNTQQVFQIFIHLQVYPKSSTSKSCQQYSPQNLINSIPHFKMSLFFFKIAPLALWLFAMIIHHSNSQPQNNTYLHAQYIKDIEHLNQKLVNYQRKEPAQIKVSTYGEQQKAIEKVVYFESETVWLGLNQQAEFSFADMKEAVIDVKVKQALLNQKDISMYSTAQEHYKKNQSHFTSASQAQLFRPCKLNDPQLQLLKLRTVPLMQFSHQLPLSEQQLLPLLTDHGEYQLIRQTGNNQFSMSKVQIDTSQHLSRTQIIEVDKVRVEGMSDGEKAVLFQYDKAGMVFSGGKLWRVKVNEEKLGLEEYAVIEELVQGQKQNQHTQETQTTQPESFSKNKTTTQQPVQIIPLKHGLLIQFQTRFQIYLQPLESPPTLPKKLLPKLSTTHLQSLTNSTIAQILISEQLSHQSGYQIFVLLKHNYLIQFQYGAYSSINVYNIPYGEWFQSFALVDDVLEVTFAVTKSKKVHFYIMELKIDRTQNPRTPTIYLNRFYNDLKDFKQAHFFNQQQLLLIGQKDILVYDWPVDSRILIHHNITQTPYHFAIDNLQSIFHLERYSTPGSNCVLLVTQQDMTVALLKRQPQTIECSSDKSFDAVIEIVKFCDSNMVEICKYVTGLRGIVENADGERISTIKRYLIAGLIIAVGVAVVVVGRQICRNKRTIQRLQKIKQSLGKKMNEMKAKGRKVAESDKFEQQQEEIPNSNQPDTKMSQIPEK